MIRDTTAEQRVRKASWIVWKLGPLLGMIFVVFIFAATVFFGLRENIGENKEGLLYLGAFLGFFFLIYLASFWVGKKLDQFQGWAWWLTMIVNTSNALTNALYAWGGLYVLILVLMGKESLPPDLNMPILVAFVVAFNLYLMVSFYVYWALVTKRARRLFTDEYRHRLEHNSFDRLEVTPR